VLYEFLPGVDGLRFGQQYRTYVGQGTAQVIDAFGVMTGGSNLQQLKDQTAGMVGVDVFNQSSDGPSTQAFVRAWQAAFPGRVLAHDSAEGFASGQILAAALTAVGGRIEDTSKFLEALYAVKTDTAKGPVALDQDHDIVENIYLYRVEKSGGSDTPRVVQTCENVSATWDRTA
jgi:branched-chain amino acid transport system substrate-binding protein